MGPPLAALLIVLLDVAAAWNRLEPTPAPTAGPAPPPTTAPAPPPEDPAPAPAPAPSKPGEPPGLCDDGVVLETCYLLDPESPTFISRGSVAAALSATGEAVAELWAKLGFRSSSVGCKEFCHTAVSVLESQGGSVPPSSDVGCYENSGGDVVCDLDLSKEAMAAAVYSSEDLPSFQGRTAADGAAEARRYLKPAGRRRRLAAGLQHSSSLGTGQTYTGHELLASVANLFRIYPRSRVYLDESGGTDASGPRRGVDLHKVNEKAKAAVLHAIRYTGASRAKELLRTWFGAGDGDSKALSQVRLVLNSVASVLRNVHYVVNDTCDADYGEYGNVFAHGRKCSGKIAEGSHCRQDEEGRPIVYLCAKTFAESESIQMGSLIHHASKHAVAYREDVEFEGEMAHKRVTCKEMARENATKALLNADNYGYFVQDMCHDAELADACLWSCRLPGEGDAGTCGDRILSGSNHASDLEACEQQQAKVSEMGTCQICHLCDACAATAEEEDGEGGDGGAGGAARRSLDRSRQWKVAAAVAGVIGVLSLAVVLILIVTLIRFRQDLRRDVGA